ncbi:MAG: hypothetical protein J1G04_05400 [Clostridiales bacterium]|nr:hypothetical protein [Clostridiales bacterium]
MDKISVKERYDFFTSALSHCGTFLLSCNDDDIAYHIFEEFDGDCISFLSDTVLDSLLSAKFISEETYHLSLELAQRFRALENTSLWSVDAIRGSKEWLCVLSIADEIKKKLSLL